MAMYMDSCSVLQPVSLLALCIKLVSDEQGLYFSRSRGHIMCPCFVCVCKCMQVSSHTYSCEWEHWCGMWCHFICVLAPSDTPQPRGRQHHKKKSQPGQDCHSNDERNVTERDVSAMFRGVEENWRVMSRWRGAEAGWTRFWGFGN